MGCFYFVIILLGFQFSSIFELRYLFYSRSSHVSFVPIFKSFFPPYFERFVPIFIIILMGLRYLFYSRNSHVSFVPIFRSFVPYAHVSCSLKQMQYRFAVIYETLSMCQLIYSKRKYWI